MPAPPRATSTSDQVEKLAKGVGIIVHSTAHPIRAGSAFPQANYLRQSSTTDLGAMDKRTGAKYLGLRIWLLFAFDLLECTANRVIFATLQNSAISCKTSPHLIDLRQMMVSMAAIEGIERDHD